MIQDFFEQLIQELSRELNLALHVDSNGACALYIQKKIVVQIQPDASNQYLIIGSFISEIPPGRFREDLFCEALKANHLPDPRVGVFGYLHSTSQLTLHQYYRLHPLTGKETASLLASFIEYSLLWKEAIDRGGLGPAPIPKQTTDPRPFGLLP